MDLLNTEEWNEQTLQLLIDSSAEESTHLEFKESRALENTDSKKEEIAKDISAFANSDGGVLIYGMVEDNHKAAKFDFIDGGVYTKEWLELTITGNISRKIDGLMIYPIRFDNDIKKTVYVVKIPVSFTAPHMVNRRKKYYKRHNFKVDEMEEYEVRQTYERKENVKLILTDFVADNKSENYLDKDFSMNLDFSINIKNIGHTVAKEYKVVATFPLEGYYTLSVFDKNEYVYTRFETTGTLSTTKSLNIFPDEELTVMVFNLVINRNGILEANLGCQLKLYFNTNIETTMLDISAFVGNFLKKHGEIMNY